VGEIVRKIRKVEVPTLRSEERRPLGTSDPSAECRGARPLLPGGGTGRSPGLDAVTARIGTGPSPVLRVRTVPRRGSNWGHARLPGVREVQVSHPHRPGMGRLDCPGCFLEAIAEIGLDGRGAKTPDTREISRGPRRGLRETGRLKLRLWHRPDDCKQDPREDAGHGEGVSEQPGRGEAEVRHDSPVLERAAGEAETVLKRSIQHNRKRWRCRS